MARDPFAPVTQPSIPPWVLPVGITFGLLFLAATATAIVLVTRRPAVQPVPPAIAAPAAPVQKPDTVAAAATSAPDKDGGKDGKDPAKDAAKDGAKDPAAKEDDDKPARAHRSGGHRARHEKVAARAGSAPAAAAPAAKKKSGMSQREIDTLLGL